MSRIRDFFGKVAGSVLTGDILQMRVYGETLYTRRVGRYLGALAIVLLLQLVLDSWAWTRLWGFALSGARWMYPLGAVFALGILVLDWTIVTHDITGSRLKAMVTFGGRIVLLLGLALLTSISVELSVFEQEINRELDKKEKVAADTIRTEAIAKETGVYEARMATANAAGTAAIGQIVTDRKAARETLLAGQKDAREAALAALKQKEDAAAVEAAGRGWSRRYGRGEAFRALDEQRRENRTALEKLDGEARAEREAFDRETERLRSGASGTDGATVAAIQKELDQKIEGLRRMTVQELAAAYPGDWVQSRGPMDRYRELQVVVDKDPRNVLVMWGCRMLMLFIGLIILLLKFLAPEEFVRYFSIRAQAVAGNAEALDAVRQQGHNVSTLSQSIGWSGNVKGHLQDLTSARIKVREALVRFHEAFHKLCRPNPDTGLCHTRAELRTLGAKKWAEIMAPALDRMEAAEDRLALEGVDIPAWPEGWEEGDPRTPDARRVWEEEGAELTSRFGWVDPTDQLAQLAAYRKEAQVGMQSLAQQVRRLQVLVLSLQGRKTPNEIAAERATFYRDQILPLVEGMEAVEMELKARGQPLLEWPKGLESEGARRQVWASGKRFTQ